MFVLVSDVSLLLCQGWTLGFGPWWVNVQWTFLGKIIFCLGLGPNLGSGIDSMLLSDTSFIWCARLNSLKLNTDFSVLNGLHSLTALVKIAAFTTRVQCCS